MTENRSVLSRPGRLPDIGLPSGDIYFGDPARPVLVLIHGGFWRPAYDRVHLRPFAAALAGLGWPVFSAEYRRVPGSPDVMVEDVRAAVEAVNRDVILIGHSAGGHLALWAGGAFAAGHGESRVRGVIALAPVANLELARQLKLDEDAVDAFLGAHDLAHFQPRLDGGVLIHGERDTIVPIAVSQSYVATAPQSRLVAIEDAAHFELIDPLSHAWPVVIDELDRLIA